MGRLFNSSGRYGIRLEKGKFIRELETRYDYILFNSKEDALKQLDIFVKLEIVKIINEIDEYSKHLAEDILTFKNRYPEYFL